MKKTIEKVSNYLYEYISSRLSQGSKVAIPIKVLEREGYDLDEMSEYFFIERSSLGLVNFRGFRKVF